MHWHRSSWTLSYNTLPFYQNKGIKDIRCTKSKSVWQMKISGESNRCINPYIMTSSSGKSIQLHCKPQSQLVAERQTFKQYKPLTSEPQCHGQGGEHNNFLKCLFFLVKHMNRSRKTSLAQEPWNTCRTSRMQQQKLHEKPSNHNIWYVIGV